VYFHGFSWQNIKMAKENTFDIVSKTDYAELENAINQTTKEVLQRFDFKGSKASVALDKKDLLMTAEDETRLRNMNDIFQSKLIKRGISLKVLDYQKIEAATGGSVRQSVKIQQGIPIEKAKEVVRYIKDEKFKVQASIQGETVRVSGKDRDTLQEVMAKLKSVDFKIDMQFDNFRSN
jgi:cyclic-di-GMP-binding protein